MEGAYYKVTTNKEDITLTPNEGYSSVLIWLHGLGDSALGYRDYFMDEVSPIPKKMKVHLLTSPRAPVSINGGMVMTSWYDILSMTKRNEDSVSKEDVIKNSIRVQKVIDEEAKLLNGDYSKVFLGGFSQGACMTLHIGLTSETNLGGLVALSGLLFPFTAKSLDEKRKDLPIFIAHGTEDEVIPQSLSYVTYDPLFNKKFTNLTYYTFDDGHTISMEESEKMRNFLEKLI